MSCSMVHHKAFYQPINDTYMYLLTELGELYRKILGLVMLFGLSAKWLRTKCFSLWPDSVNMYFIIIWPNSKMSFWKLKIGGGKGEARIDWYKQFISNVHTGCQIQSCVSFPWFQPCEGQWEHQVFWLPTLHQLPPTK